MDMNSRRIRSTSAAAQISQNALAALKPRGMIAALRAAAGLDAPAREALASLEGRQLLSAATIIGAAANQAVNDSATLSPFSSIVIDDTDSSIVNVEVQLDNSARGVFTSSSLTSSGFSDEGSGRYSRFGTPSEVTTAIQALIFNPTDNRVPVTFSETTRFTISVDDATDVTTNNVTTVRSISANDAPSMGGFTTATINDSATTSPFSSVTLTDPDPYQSLSLVITVDAAAKGVFTNASLASNGFTSAGGGIYTASARVSALQTAIRALVYNPTNDRVAVASTETTTFTIQLSDSVASPIQDNSTTVTSTSVNDAPTISGAAAGQAVLDNASITPFANVSIADVDPSSSLSITVSLDTAAKGAFTGGSLTSSGFVDAGGGTYTFSGTPAASTTAIRALVFEPAENRVLVGSTETTTFTIAANDGTASTTNTTTTAVASPFNDASSITGASAGQAVNDNATVSPFTSLTIADVDSPDQTLTLTIAVGNYTYGLFTSGSVTTAGMTYAGSGSYTRTGTASALTTAIQALVFAPVENIIAIGSTETATFNISVADGLIAAVTDATSTAIVSPINDALVIGGASAGQTTNDDTNITPFAAVTFSDVDLPGQTFTATISLDTAAKGAFTSASLTSTGFSSAGAGSYTRTGTPSQLQTAIRALVYNPTDNRVALVSTETTTFTITLGDGLLSDVTNTTTTVISTSVNVAPSISGASAGQTSDDNATISPFSAVTLDDVDGDTLDVSVSLDTAAKGIFTSGSLTTSGFIDAGAGVYTFSGTASAATTAIRALVFAPTVNRSAVGETETTTLTIAIDDNIASTVTNTTTTVISAAFNDASTLGGASSSQAVNDNATLSPFTSFTIADADSPAQTLIFTVSLDVASKGTFTAGSLTTAGVTDNSDGTYSRTGTASQLQTAIRALVFQPTANRVAVGAIETTTLSVSVSDGILAPVTNAITTVVSTSIDNATTIAGTVAGQAVNDNATISPFSSITIADVDPNTITTIVIYGDYAKGGFTNASLSASGFAIAYFDNWTLFDVTPAQATTALRALVYQPTANRLNVGSSETHEFTVRADNGTPVDDTTTTVIQTSVNDAPTVTGVTSAGAVNDNASILPFSAMTIADADTGSQTQSISVTISDTAHGTFTSGSISAAGFTDAGSGTFTFSGTAAAATTAIRLLSFQPVANRIALGTSEDTGFNVSVTDSASANTTNTSTLVITTPHNDMASISGTSSNQPVNDVGELFPFASVTIADADGATQSLTLSITLDAAAKGVFTSASLTSAGFTNAGSGVYTRTGIASALTTAIQALVFDPANNRVNPTLTETSTFTLAVSDALVGINTSNATTTVISTSINDAPSVSAGTASQAVGDNATISPFSTMTIADADVAQSLTITVGLSSAANGAFTSASLSASGFTQTNSATYSFSGTSAAAQAAIRALVFQPTNNAVAVGSTQTTTFTVTVSDAIASDVSDANTTVVSTSINDDPTIGGASSSQAVNDDATLAPFASLTIDDVDPNQAVTVTVTPDAIAKGTFTFSSISASGFTASGNAFTFTGTAAAAQTAIRQLTFDPTNNRTAVGTTETTTFNINVTDASLASVSNTTTTVVSTSINDAPTIGGASSGQAVNDNATLAPFASLTIDDVDPNQAVTVTVTPDAIAKGTFTFSSISASGFTASGNAFTFTGTAAAAQTAIRQLTFDPTNNRTAVGTTETTTFNINVTDASLASVSNTTTTVVSTSINDSPTIGGASSGQVVNDNQTIAPFSTFTIADVDPAQNVTVIIARDSAAKGTFTPASLSASSFTASDNNFTFTGSAAAAETAIRQLIFNPTDNRVSVGSTETTTLTVTVTDASAASVSNNSTTVASASFNDAPTAANFSTGTTLGDNESTNPFADVTINDSDVNDTITLFVTQWNSATGSFLEASIVNGGFDLLSPGFLRFTGTAAAAQTAMQQLVFSPTTNRNPVGVSEFSNFSVNVYDASGAVTGDTASIAATSINNTPTVAGLATGIAGNDNATTRPFANATIADVDVNESVTVYVAPWSATAGNFTTASLSSAGFAQSGQGLFVFVGTPAAATTAVRALVYSPVTNAIAVGSTQTSTFSLTVYDANAASAGGTASTIATSVNDAPTLTGTASGVAATDAASAQPFANVTLADIDAGQQLSLFISEWNPAAGNFSQGSLTAAGAQTISQGVHRFSGTAAAITSALRSLVYTPTANAVAVGQSQTATFSISAYDTADASVGSISSYIFTSVNNAPAISGTADAGIIDDTATAAPFASVIITDVDPATTITARVTIDSASKGTFSVANLETSGLTSSGNGVYTFTGTPAATTTALRALLFTPTLNSLAGGATQSVGFNLQVSDGVASIVSDSASTLTVRGVNEQPTIGTLASSLAAIRTGQALTLTASNVSDVDGTITAVQFWRDANANGTLDEADTLLGTDTSSSGGWSLATVADSTWGAGTTSLFARSIDNDGAGAAAPASTSVAVLANTGALVSALSSNVPSATLRQTITLTATGISSSSGAIRSVAFYQDTNRNGAWDASDRKISTDTSASGGYTSSVAINPAWAAGTQFFFARATDSAGLGAPAALAFTIAPNAAPTANSIGLSSSTLPSNNRVTLTLNGGADSDGSIASVEYYADVNGNGTLDAADRKLSTRTNITGNFASPVTLNRAWATAGSIRLFAKAIDNNGLAGSTLTTTIQAA